MTYSISPPSKKANNQYQKLTQQPNMLGAKSSDYLEKDATQRLNSENNEENTENNEDSIE